jgi:hypothetical protein
MVWPCGTVRSRAAPCGAVRSHAAPCGGARNCDESHPPSLSRGSVPDRVSHEGVCLRHAVCTRQNQRVESQFRHLRHQRSGMARSSGVVCRVAGLCGLRGAGCMVQGSGFRVQGSGCRVHGSGCRVHGSVRSGRPSRSRRRPAVAGIQNFFRYNGLITRHRYLAVIYSFQRKLFAVATKAECDCRTLLVQGRGSVSSL